MVTMKGYTSSIPLLLVLIHMGCVIRAENGPTDYLPTSVHKIFLPTTAGTFDKSTIEKEFGNFPAVYSQCGSISVTGKAVGVDSDKTFDMRQDCSPHPMRVIYTTEQSTQFNGETGDITDLSKCQGQQTCSNTPDLSKTNLGGTVVDGSSAQALFSLKKDEDICEQLGANAKVLFSNEMGCDRDAKVPKPNDNQNKVYIAPRWQTNTNNLFNDIRAFTLTGQGIVGPENRTVPRTNNFLQLPKPTALDPENDWVSCIGGCDQGDIIKFNMNEGSWKTTIYLKGKSKGFKMCVGSDAHDTDGKTQPECRSKFELFVLPRNGLVIWPLDGRASTIQLKPFDIGDADAYSIELGFGFKKNDKDGNEKPRGEFYVANMFREVVTSDSTGWNDNQTNHVTFFFQSPDDLVQNGGIVSGQIQTGKTFISKQQASQITEKKVMKPIKGYRVEGGQETLDNVVPETPKAIIHTTTPAPKRLSSNAHLGMLLHSTDHTNDAIYMPGKWWAWGVYIGFIIGSLVGVAVIGGIFYVLRRTVYGFWYRGMYKRYGCDASGTTGGITGVGFGTTTAGAITVGGGTTGGGTTAGTTRGGTTTRTSGTTGGGTTMTSTGGSTGGSSTIAM